MAKYINNPSGKGGFGDNPENRNPGGWKKEDSISYQYDKLMRMTEAEIAVWVQDETKTIAQTLAYNALKRAHRSLPDLKEITDRTEGKPNQSSDITSNGETIGVPLLGGEQVNDVQENDSD